MSQKFSEHCICKFIAFISQGFSVKSFYFRSIPCCCVKKTAIVQIKTKTRDIIESDDDDVIWLRQNGSDESNGINIDGFVVRL
jgi:hypothetical protein